MNNCVISKEVKEDISIICSRNPKERIPMLINILYEYGIKEKKKVYMQTFDLNSSYYINRLLSLITKTDFRLIESYMFPIGAKIKELQKTKINYKNFMMALEMLRESNIVISSSKVFSEESWLDYIFNQDIKDSYDVIIIDNFAKFLESCHEDAKVVKKVIQNYSQKYKASIILFASENDEFKEIFSNWQITKINETLTFIFDPFNYNILDIVRKDNKDERKN